MRISIIVYSIIYSATKIKYLSVRLGGNPARKTTLPPLFFSVTNLLIIACLCQQSANSKGIVYHKETHIIIQTVLNTIQCIYIV